MIMFLFGLIITFYSLVFGLWAVMAIINGIYWLFGGYSTSKYASPRKQWENQQQQVQNKIDLRQYEHEQCEERLFRRTNRKQMNQALKEAEKCR